VREAHAHIAAYGQSLSLPNLATCASLAECLDRIRDLASTVRAGEWIRLLGARIEAWPERRWPTLTELDRAAPHRPCFIMSFDHHAAAANTPALRAGGLWVPRLSEAGSSSTSDQRGIPVPPNGLVCTDDLGNPTGLLLEHAAYKVWDAAPEPTRAQCRENVRLALQSLHALGYREVHDLHSQDWLGPILADLDTNNEMPMDRVLLFAPITKLAAAHQTRARWENLKLRLAGGKLFADGTLNSRTAHMLTPYAQPLNNQPFGQPMATREQIAEALTITRSLDLTLAIHAIGDAAVRTVLDVFESASPSIPRSLDPSIPPLRLEHAELIDSADIPRFAQLGVIASVQPCHLLSDMEVLTRQLPNRLDRVLPLRDLLDSGAEVWFGSDVPIVPADPQDSLQAALHRRRKDQPDSASIAAHQRITDLEAHTCFKAPAIEP
jgi:predicted amidohydrolase YtcJ